MKEEKEYSPCLHPSSLPFLSILNFALAVYPVVDYKGSCYTKHVKYSQKHVTQSNKQTWEKYNKAH
jgi:hypothetical protein